MAGRSEAYRKRKLELEEDEKLLEVAAEARRVAKNKEREEKRRKEEEEMKAFEERMTLRRKKRLNIHHNVAEEVAVNVVTTEDSNNGSINNVVIAPLAPIDEAASSNVDEKILVEAASSIVDEKILTPTLTTTCTGYSDDEFNDKFDMVQDVLAAADAVALKNITSFVRLDQPTEKVIQEKPTEFSETNASTVEAVKVFSKRQNYGECEVEPAFTISTTYTKLEQVEAAIGRETLVRDGAERFIEIVKQDKSLDSVDRRREAERVFDQAVVRIQLLNAEAKVLRVAMEQAASSPYSNLRHRHVTRDTAVPNSSSPLGVVNYNRVGVKRQRLTPSQLDMDRLLQLDENGRAVIVASKATNVSSASSSVEAPMVLARSARLSVTNLYIRLETQKAKEYNANCDGDINDSNQSMQEHRIHCTLSVGDTTESTEVCSATGHGHRYAVAFPSFQFDVANTMADFELYVSVLDNSVIQAQRVQGSRFNTLRKKIFKGDSDSRCSLSTTATSALLGEVMITRHDITGINTGTRRVIREVIDECTNVSCYVEMDITLEQDKLPTRSNFADVNLDPLFNIWDWLWVTIDDRDSISIWKSEEATVPLKRLSFAEIVCTRRADRNAESMRRNTCVIEMTNGAKIFISENCESNMDQFISDLEQRRADFRQWKPMKNHNQHRSDAVTTMFAESSNTTSMLKT